MTTQRPSLSSLTLQPFSSRFSRVACASLLSAFVLAPLSGCKGQYSLASLTHYFHHRKSVSKPNSTDYASNIQSAIGNPQMASLKWPDTSDVQPLVQQFYTDRNFEIAWTRDGKPTDQATRLIQLFGDAAKKGLQPTDYDSEHWGQRVQQLQGHAQDGDALAQFDAAMTVTAMRYLSDLHFGRINPQSLNFDIDVPARRTSYDLPTLVNDKLVDADDVPSIVASVEPQNPMYKSTEDALPRYLELASKQTAQPLPAVGKTVAPGGNYPGIDLLVQRLALEGDGQVQATGSGYTPELSQAVQHFQNRTGLMPDGKLTQETVDALNVPMSARVLQINDALEKWRWLPDNFVKPRVLVNLPEYYVRTYNPGGDLAFKMKVVDGQAKDGHDTPVFVRTMRFLIFRPYWNLPPSIVKKDLLKHASPAYLEAHEYEVTDSSGKPVSGWTTADLEHSRYMVRQKPGPKNSLGLVKFMFPNEYDIYLHSTPEMNLFNLAQRDRSHGCVRLNDAEKMADWVLNGQGDWTPDKIHAAMFGTGNSNGDASGGDDKNSDKGSAGQTSSDPDSGTSSTYGDLHDNKQVNLQNQLPVVITYFTANADEDGTMHFFSDMYGYDKDLEASLAKPRPYDQKTVKINPKLTAGETE
ncbi:MAG: L,D-transpeptidase family protein [Janthinobacterium lividum]